MITTKHKLWMVSSLFSLSFAASPIAVARNLPSIQPINPLALTKQNSQCVNTLAAVKQKIRQNHDFAVSFEFNEKMPYRGWRDAIPSGTDKHLGITLGDKPSEARHPRILDVMFSPAFRNTIATDIIDSCPDVGLVSLGRTNTGDVVYYGVVNSRVQQFECLQPRSLRDGDPVPWGFAFCT
ncbi:hypothetical protein [Roseofilum casamattae]|uniref:Uncharacterized protein n=1 Tax=Roseofilum casamattae BLCC-M143 TaxID=3022442 RepID=A0ABT7BZ43_9CYAN|nr:hypothetical protein [Roseofilum casamattae]MDJ1184467.1 hypothetical protein [Roseofilum casamattae BLCC-M143]